MEEYDKIPGSNVPDRDNDAAFDAYLSGILPEEADDGISRSVSPWHRSMTYILISLALGLINLRFLALDLILPAVSFAFGLLGWVGLRHENRGFRAGWILMLVRTAVFLLGVFQSMTIWSTEDLIGKTGFAVLQIFYAILPISQLFALRRGISLLQAKAKVPENTAPVSGLILWYIALAVLALLGTEGFIVIIMLVIMVFCLIQLNRLTETMEEAGYLVEPAPVRLRPAAMLGLYFGILVLGCTLSFLLFSRYPMKWQEKEALRSDAAAAIAARLETLGFPEEVLKDLTEEDLLCCEGAQDVMKKDFNFYYDSSGFRLQSVAVVLAQSPRTWQIFYHFSLKDQERYWGTESLELRPEHLLGFTSLILEEPHGYLFTEQNGITKMAPISRIRYEEYTERNGTWGTARNGWFAEFSPPSALRNFRGYVSVKVQNIYEEIDFSWPNAWNLILERYGTQGLIYTHQLNAWQYPVLSARNYAKQNGSINPAAAFVKIYVESWFMPDELNPLISQTSSTSP